MYRRFLFLLIIALLSMTIFMVTAQEDEDDLNWCSDGPWVGICNENPEMAEFFWQCGWYMAHVQAGYFTIWDVPCWCASVMPNADGDWYPDHVDACPLNGWDETGDMPPDLTCFPSWDDYWDWWESRSEEDWWQWDKWFDACRYDLGMPPWKGIGVIGIN